MHWNTDIFRDLHDEIQKANLQINSDYGMSLFSSIEGSFNEIVDDLKSFSAAPPKSEVNRKKLETGMYIKVQVSQQ